METDRNRMTGGLIRLWADDNVLVAPGPVPAGHVQIADGGTLHVITPVTLGHKLAAKDIRTGEKIIKYGVPIGSATTVIPAGTHVHVHNMKSDYTATHTLDQTEKGESNA